jgi:hypothetical protein
MGKSGLNKGRCGWFTFFKCSSYFSKSKKKIFAVKLGSLNIVDGVHLVNVSWFPIGQQGSRDFVSHQNLSPIGWEDLPTEPESKILLRELKLALKWG